jgi:hypothetical protein
MYRRLLTILHIHFLPFASAGTRFLAATILIACYFSVSSFAAVTSGGTCPASAPVTGNNCFFIAANGSDSNSGTTESTPWLHAPGMPNWNCTGNCSFTPPGVGGSLAGYGFILRGGDTWHFGNSSASPYTGGTWLIYNWAGNSSTCTYTNRTGCVYWGVDTTWYNSTVCGSSWCRPILNGDNPLSTSRVSSCAYKIGANNRMVSLGSGTDYYNVFDNFELLGLCAQSQSNTNQNTDVYLQDAGSGITGQGMLYVLNVYIHGWTASNAAGTQSHGSVAACQSFGDCAVPGFVMGGGNQSLWTISNIVIDGSDSDDRVFAWAFAPTFYYFKDSIVRYTTQGVSQNCHDIHDNIFEHMDIPDVPTHGNVLECNTDSPGNLPVVPSGTPNLAYNNIFRHDSTRFPGSGNPDFWLCPNSTPEYWFNNLLYDLGGEGWSIAGPAQYPSCSNSGGQYMFNNTLVDLPGGQPCHLQTASNGTNGQYLTVLNEHLINTNYDAGGGGCTGYNDSSNVQMSDTAATSQGYTLGTAGSSQGNTCANEGSTPCAPTSSSDGTVNTGANRMAYCNVLAGYTSEYAISTEAANACTFSTTDGCLYNTTTHTMTCSTQMAVARPPAGVWNAGAYQYSASNPPPPAVQPPTSLTAATH